MRNRILLILSLAWALAAGARAGELFLGFAAEAPLVSGDADTLQWAAAADLGPITAMVGAGGDDLWIASGAGGSSLCRFDGARKTVLATHALPHGVVALAFGDSALFACAADGTLSTIDAATGAVLASTATGFAACALLADGGRLYLATAGGTVWSTLESAFVSGPAWHAEISGLPPIRALAARGSALLVAVHAHVHVFQRDTGVMMYGYNVPNDAVALALQGNDVLVGGSDGSVARVDPATGEVLMLGACTSPAGAPLPVSAAVVTHAAPFASLAPNVTFMSIGEPAPVQLRLEVAHEVGALPFLMLGSVTGSDPGVMLAGTHVPLNQDAYFMLTLAGSPTLLGGFGTFSDRNALQVPMADAAFQVPTGLSAALAGLKIRHAFLVFDSGAGKIRAVSDPAITFLAP